MTLRTRLTLGIVAIGIVLIAPLVIALRSLAELHASTARLSTHEFAASLLLTRMRGGVDALRRADDNVVILHDQPSAAEMHRALDTLATLADSLRAFARERTFAGDSAARQVQTAVIVLRDSGTAEIEAALRGRVADAERLSQGVIAPALGEIDRALLRAENSLGVGMRAHVAASADASDRARRIAAMALAVALVLAAMIAVWLTRSISGPVGDLQRGMQAVADGRLDYRLTLDPRRADEFGRLAGSFASMARQLAALDRMKAEFVSIASHELKTPLNVILGYVQLLDEGVFGELTPKQREICRTLTAQGRSLSRLINQLLDISRFQAGAGKLETRSVRLQSFLDDLERAFRVLALQREVEFRVQRGDGLPDEVCWDVDRMNEVLGNLLSNAFKFTPRGGRVELDITSTDGSLRVDVCDTGVGIPADQLPYIFKKFYQADNQRGASASGTGLGLAIANEIVNAHGGAITVASTPGTGTTFSITLPTRVESGRRVARPEPEAELVST